VTLLKVQDVTLLVALVILIGATRGRLGYDAAPPERSRGYAISAGDG